MITCKKIIVKKTAEAVKDINQVINDMKQEHTVIVDPDVLSRLMISLAQTDEKFSDIEIYSDRGVISIDGVVPKDLQYNTTLKYITFLGDQDKAYSDYKSAKDFELVNTREEVEENTFKDVVMNGETEDKDVVIDLLPDTGNENQYVPPKKEKKDISEENDEMFSSEGN